MSTFLLQNLYTRNFFRIVLYASINALQSLNMQAEISRSSVLGASSLMQSFDTSLLLISHVQVRRLIDGGANVNEPSTGPKSPGCSPLHLAAAGGHIDVMDELLDRGADIEARTRGSCGCKLALALYHYSCHASICT